MLIYLLGYMYSGKSTLGKKLARAMNYHFVDTDKLFEEKYQLSIDVFFRKYEEPLFRQLERDILYSTANRENTVIACGGGTPCFYENMSFIKTHGISVYLRAELALIYARMRQSSQVRPLLYQLSPEEQRSFVASQLRERELYYAQADLTFPAENAHIATLVEKIGDYLPS